MKLKLQHIIPALVCLILLIVTDYFMQPAPLSAALAVVAGLVAWFFRKDRLGLSLGMLFGTLCAIAWHGYQHKSGQSTSPDEGLLWHLVLDGLIGYLIAGVILWLAILSQTLLNISARNSSKEE